MDSEILKKLDEVLKNQVAIYRKLHILESKLINKTAKAFYDFNAALKDLKKDTADQKSM